MVSGLLSLFPLPPRGRLRGACARAGGGYGAYDIIRSWEYVPVCDVLCWLYVMLLPTVEGAGKERIMHILRSIYLSIILLPLSRK